MKEFLLSDWGLAAVCGLIVAVGIVVLAIDRRRHPGNYYEHFSDYPDND